MKEELKDFENLLESTKDLLIKLIEKEEQKIKILTENPEKRIAIAKALNELNKRKKNDKPRRRIQS